MALYVIIKGGENFGPFALNDIQEFVKAGLVLKRDRVFEIADSTRIYTVNELLKANDANIQVEHRGNLFTQLKDIGSELIFPEHVFSNGEWKHDKTLLILSIVGLTMSVVLTIAPFSNTYLLFYLIALYFSIIWGVLFYYLFKTEEVSVGTTVVVFFSTQIAMFIAAVSFLWLIPFGELYNSSSYAVSFVSCFLGIGIPEELIKLTPIFFLLYMARRTYNPQTIVYYGLMSGIGFGVYEGVQYQLGPNFEIMSKFALEEGYVVSFVSNVSRLTCLPFLHAIWCAIGSYFVAFAFLYPRYRISLFFLAIVIPAFLHGLYDSMCFHGFSILVLPVVFAGVILLMAYLKIKYNYHSILSD